MNKLKQCPFCGGDALVSESCYNDKWFVQCLEDEKHCIGHFGGEGDYETKEAATEAWNQRV